MIYIYVIICIHIKCFQKLENGLSTVQNFYIWNRYNRMSGPTPKFILWLQLSASSHYLIDSTPDTMRQHFWRYISTSNNKCPSQLSLLALQFFGMSLPIILSRFVTLWMGKQVIGHTYRAAIAKKNVSPGAYRESGIWCSKKIINNWLSNAMHSLPECGFEKLK